MLDLSTPKQQKAKTQIYPEYDQVSGPHLNPIQSNPIQPQTQPQDTKTPPQAGVAGSRTGQGVRAFSLSLLYSI